jgi:dTDP-4-dehydrorhamnose reductase
MFSDSKVLILGGYGFLGGYLSETLRSEGYTVCLQGRADGSEVKWSVRDSAELTEQLEKHQPDVLINLIAETNVDKCEEEPQIAYIANVRSVELIAQAIHQYRRKKDIRLIHISSDQVYSGKGPHVEDDACPMNVYALSKYAGEFPAIKENALVLRANFIGRGRDAVKASFSDWLYNSAANKKEITVFEDVMFNPLHVSTLSDVIAELIRQPHSAGVFNLGSVDGLSKAAFAFEFINAVGLSTETVRKGKQHDVILKARRPDDMETDINRFQETFSITLPRLSSEIKKLAEQYL